MMTNELSDYDKVFEAVSGKIEIDTEYTPEEYMQMLEDTKIYDADIINMCGGLIAISLLPKLTLVEERFRGDYIDFLRPGDLDAPMMRGIDHWNRPFIAFRYKIRLPSGPNENITEVETIFQRYSHQKSIWTSGGNAHQISMHHPRITNSDSKEQIAEHLLRLIKKEPVGYVGIISYTPFQMGEKNERTNEAGLSIVFLA